MISSPMLSRGTELFAELGGANFMVLRRVAPWGGAVKSVFTRCGVFGAGLHSIKA
jgi:hypothetical protein